MGPDRALGWWAEPGVPCVQALALVKRVQAITGAKKEDAWIKVLPLTLVVWGWGGCRDKFFSLPWFLHSPICPL